MHLVSQSSLILHVLSSDPATWPPLCIPSILLSQLPASEVLSFCLFTHTERVYKQNIEVLDVARTTWEKEHTSTAEVGGCCLQALFDR